MTEYQWEAIEPGDILRTSSGRHRVVVSVWRFKSKPPVLELRKVGHSWTDPCPFTTYNRSDMMRKVAATGRRMRVTGAMLDCPVHGGMHHRRLP